VTKKKKKILELDKDITDKNDEISNLKINITYKEFHTKIDQEIKKVKDDVVSYLDQELKGINDHLTIIQYTLLVKMMMNIWNHFGSISNLF
jgi:23S rRNA U2552 (ribose-2'-O)-methylase RlmE/FtsJ